MAAMHGHRIILLEQITEKRSKGDWRLDYEPSAMQEFRHHNHVVAA